LLEINSRRALRGFNGNVHRQGAPGLLSKLCVGIFVCAVRLARGSGSYNRLSLATWRSLSLLISPGESAARKAPHCTHLFLIAALRLSCLTLCLFEDLGERDAWPWLNARHFLAA
jgi:hypothetical protein